MKGRIQGEKDRRDEKKKRILMEEGSRSSGKKAIKDKLKEKNTSYSMR